MSNRAMIVVAGGFSSRFGGDKLMEVVGGLPLVAHTVSAVAPHVDTCVLVCRADQAVTLSEYELAAVIVGGGPTRTTSEMAGLAAVGGEPDLIGIHDGARPLIAPALIEALFEAAAISGGAVPVLDPPHPLVDREKLRPATEAKFVQTPQVFEASMLLAAYVRAAQTDFEGHDTADIVQEFADVEIAAVPGDPENLKVTYPDDLVLVRNRLEGLSRNGPG